MRLRTLVTTACLLAQAPIGVTQTESGSLRGTIIGPDGLAVVDAPVRMRSAATGTDARIYSSPTGDFEILELPAGTYILSINMPCCSFVPYLNGNVQLEPGQVTELAVNLLEAGSMNTLSDDPGTLAAEMRDRQVIPDLPVPRMPDGEPSLSGVWLVSEDPFPEQPKALPWAAELLRERLGNGLLDHPHMRCLPADPPVPGAVAPFIGKFVQTPQLLVILFEDAPGFRQIFLDGRDHPADPNPSWMGHSIGRWEGDTLVVDTVGFNTTGWTENFPRTEMMHLVERYRRPEYGLLEVHVTIDDPGVFEEPWTQNMEWHLAPQEELIEYVCENNKMTNE